VKEKEGTGPLIRRPPVGDLKFFAGKKHMLGQEDKEENGDPYRQALFRSPVAMKVRHKRNSGGFGFHQKKRQRSVKKDATTSKKKKKKKKEEFFPTDARSRKSYPAFESRTKARKQTTFSPLMKEEGIVP